MKAEYIITLHTEETKNVLVNVSSHSPLPQKGL